MYNKAEWRSLVLMFPGMRRLTIGSRYLVTLLSNITVQCSPTKQNATQIHVQRDVSLKLYVA